MPGTPLTWFQLTVHTDPAEIDRWTVALIEHGSSGIWERDVGVLTAYFPADRTVEKLQEELNVLFASFNDGLATIVGPSPVPPEDWTAAWKSSFTPLRVTPRLVIAPTWSSYRALSDERVVRLDPGMAFGTGHHETTRACLRFLDRSLLAQPSASVLDFGTGSGILAIAAAGLGDGKIVACDVDPEAVAVARANVGANGLSGRITIVDAETARGFGPYDLIVANLDASSLIDEMPRVASILARGGCLFMAGILVQQEQPIVAAAERAELSPVERERDGEWVAMTVRKSRPSPQLIDFTTSRV
jgi:ribosomal protein L11 methyltransferase